MYQGDSLVGFNLLQEQTLIQKLIYKEIYREDVLMWMDLWEKERRQSEYLYNALENSNKLLIKQDALLIKSDDLRKHCEKTAKEAMSKVSELEDANRKLSTVATISTPLAFVTGFIVAILVKK